MASLIASISNILQDIFSVVLLLFSLFYCFRKYNPVYMRSLPIYSIGNVLANFFNRFYPDTRPVVNIIFTAFELVYFVYFLTRVIKSGTVKKLVWVLTGLFLSNDIYHVAKKDFKENLGLPEVYECIILIIPCMVYFREILLKPKIAELRKEPSFWMVTGILFYFFLLIPTLFISSYFQYKKMDDVAEAFYSVNNYSQLISYILFIKAMRCRRKEPF